VELYALQSHDSTLKIRHSNLNNSIRAQHQPEFVHFRLLRGVESSTPMTIMTDRGTESESLPSTSDILNNMSNRLVSPPGSRTPPTKNTLPFPDTSGNHSHLSNLSEAVDPAALASALRDYDEAGRRRERTPGASPSRKRQRVYGDR
jgi:hypothetical protein